MTTSKKNLKRRDATGHLNPRYARDLLEKAGEHRNNGDNPRSDRGFLSGPRSDEELAEELGEAFVESATSGEEAEIERHERITPEELGGPYVATSVGEELSEATDDSESPD